MTWMLFIILVVSPLPGLSGDVLPKFETRMVSNLKAFDTEKACNDALVSVRSTTDAILFSSIPMRVDSYSFCAKGFYN